MRSRSHRYVALPWERYVLRCLHRMSKLAEDVGARIVKLRQAAGYSQRDLADRVGGVTHNAIGYIERGTNTAVTYDLLDGIARVLDVEPVDLFNSPWSEQGIPWRHVAREQVRLTPSKDLTKLVNMLERFASVPLADLLEAAAIVEARRRR
jgi:transcriptional regulator with XRE-family HTH domain